MAQREKQRPSPLEEPPSASPSSDSDSDDQHIYTLHHNIVQEEEDASSEEDEEDEEEQNQPPSLPTNPNSHSIPKPLSSSESESKTESDSASFTQAKPAPQAQAQKPKAQPSPSPRPSSGSKRVVDNNAHASDPKRAKKKVTDSSASASVPPSDDDAKKKPPQRLWNDDDQLAVLRGMAQFISNTGQDPYKHANDFHDFIKKSLRVPVSSNQLKEKIRRLKKKFEVTAEKVKKGEDPKFPKAHDQKAFELSEKVWGSVPVSNGTVEKAKCNGKTVKKTPKKEIVKKTPKKESGVRNAASSMKLEAERGVASGDVDLKEREEEVGVDWSFVVSELSRFQSFHGLNEEEAKRGLDLMGESKRAELEGKWKKLRAAETELFANRAILIGEQTRLILEVLHSSNH